MLAEQALKELIEGNGQFVRSQPLHPRQDAGRGRDVAKGQRPFATILGCADSRVPPELIFDQGVGDLFLVRPAGHVPDRAVLGSIELGVQEFGIPLIVVLGHSRCGAVAFTVESLERKQEPQGDIRALTKAISPSVERGGGSPAISWTVRFEPTSCSPWPS